MRETSAAYQELVKGNTRRFGFRFALRSESSLYPSEILEISISRAISDGFQIGACGSDRLCLVTKAIDRVQKGSIITAYCYPGGHPLETEPLGVYYADEVSTENGITTIIAYDRMNRNLDKVVRWTKDTAPSFPATQQQMLDYICALKGITCNFTCQPFVVQEKPVGYTAREIIGFIAACHAANAHFNAQGELIFKQFTQTDAVIDRLRCYSHTASNDDGFTVNGVLFDLGNDTRVFIDGSASEYDEDAEGIVEVFCPFASVEVAEYVWHMLGGLTYYSCSLEMPAENLLEVGDVFTTTDAQGNTVSSIVLEQELSVTTDGFREAISAAAESDSNQRSTTNRIENLENSISSGGSGGGSGTLLKEYEVISDDKIKYNGATYTITTNADGVITTVENNSGGKFSPKLLAATNVNLHNAAFLAVALMSVLPQKRIDIPNLVARYNLDKYHEQEASDGAYKAVVFDDQIGHSQGYELRNGVIDDGGVKISPYSSAANIGYCKLDLDVPLTKYCMYFVINEDTLNGDVRTLYVNSEQDGILISICGYHINYYYNRSWRAGVKDGGDAVVISDNYPGKIVVCIRCDGTKTDFFVNGIISGTVEKAQVIPYDAYFSNGHYAYYYFDTGNIWIYDIAVCDFAHDDATIKAASLYLMDKYSIKS